jgi:hypothetical protein
LPHFKFAKKKKTIFRDRGHIHGTCKCPNKDTGFRIQITWCVTTPHAAQYIPGPVSALRGYKYCPAAVTVAGTDDKKTCSYMICWFSLSPARDSSKLRYSAPQGC